MVVSGKITLGYHARLQKQSRLLYKEQGRIDAWQQHAALHQALRDRAQVAQQRCQQGRPHACCPGACMGRQIICELCSSYATFMAACPSLHMRTSSRVFAIAALPGS